MTAAAAPAPARPAPRPYVAPAVTAEGLTKHYGERAAVDELTFSVPQGVVAGFVGANGAGKTTTIRMLLGLIASTSGAASVLGFPHTEPARYMGRVGALVEAPVIYPALSGRRNLEVLAALEGHGPRRVAEVLETVGLTDRADDQSRRYSLGMKQRLGIAGALLPDPQFLVLDEPTNGLDPPGILEIRALLRRFADDGRTVFVSSHLLAEVQHVADYLVMIAHGRLLVEGSLQDILAGQRSELVAAPQHPGDVAELARLAERAGHPTLIREGRVRVQAPAGFGAELNRMAFEDGLVLGELREEQPSLEDTFLALNQTRDASSAGPAAKRLEES